jgi:hypothetical protein
MLAGDGGKLEALTPTHRTNKITLLCLMKGNILVPCDSVNIRSSHGPLFLPRNTSVFGWQWQCGHKGHEPDHLEHLLG